MPRDNITIKPCILPIQYTKAYHPVFVNCPGHISGQILRIWPDFDQFLPIHPDKIGLKIRTNWLNLLEENFEYLK